MSERIRIREVVEYEIEVSEADKDIPENWPDLYQAENYESVVREVLSREEVVDYVIDIDTERQVHILRGNGKEVFAHRSHDVMLREFLKITDQEENVVRGMWWDDEEDVDLSWRV